MKKLILLSAFLTLTVHFGTFDQEVKPEEKKRESGHYDENKFRQMYDEMATPNMFRTASGAPGPAYYQQKADYKMALTIDDETQKLYGVETITYTNNSPDRLDYLWLQLDQNIYAENSDSKVIEIEKMENFKSIGDIRKKFFKYDGGFKIEYIKSTSGQAMRYAINKTMLRIDLDKPLLPNSSISFQIKWMYNINDRNNMAKNIEAAIAKGVDPLSVKCAYETNSNPICITYAATVKK